MKATILQLDPKTYNAPVPTLGPPVWLRIRRVHFNDFQTAAATVNLPVAFAPAGLLVLGAFFVFQTNFTGGAIATATMAFGTGASPGLFIAATTVFSGAPKVNPGLTLVPGTFANAPSPAAPIALQLQLVLTGGVGTALTSGRGDLYMQVAGIDIRTT